MDRKKKSNHFPLKFCQIPFLVWTTDRDDLAALGTLRSVFLSRKIMSPPARYITPIYLLLWKCFFLFVPIVSFDRWDCSNVTLFCERSRSQEALREKDWVTFYYCNAVETPSAWKIKFKKREPVLAAGCQHFSIHVVKSRTKSELSCK